MSGYFFLSLFMLSSVLSIAQVDTSYIFNPAAAYGPLDIRIARSSSDYYYLQEGQTFSFRQTDGTPTDSYLDMTAWDSEPYQQGNLRRRVNEDDNFVMNYRLLFPHDYDASSPEGYPLVIVLHGLHESGNCAGSDCHHGSVNYDPNENAPAAPVNPDSRLLNNDYNLVHGGWNYLDAHIASEGFTHTDDDLPARAFPGFVLFPQNLKGWEVESVEDAIRLVRLIAKRYNIATERIYLNGISNGGHGAYEMLKRAPWLFAAGVMFSAADDASITTDNLEALIAPVPLWLFQGGIDAKPTVKQTEEYIRQFRNGGANIRYTRYNELGHGTWNKGFSEPDFFTWMLGHTSSDIHVFADNPTICPTSGKGALLTLREGYQHYEWQYNGVGIAGKHDFMLEADQVGGYRGRAQKADGEWGGWSKLITVSEANATAPTLLQRGTVLLKDPNQNDEAILQVNDSYAHYYWFKDGKQINLPGEHDDTTKRARIAATFGDGVYTLKAAGFDQCISLASEGKHIFFSDRAPINLETPGAITFTGLAASKVSLLWEDRSGAEGGFEIWRHEHHTGKAHWEMLDLVESNASSFEDNGLVPNTAYQYIVRAVSNTGRSEYSRSSVINTPPDNDPPSAPANLEAQLEGAKRIRLRWDASSDNASIKEYLIFTGSDTIRTRSSDNGFAFTDFTVNTMYRFFVKAVDMGENISAPSNSAYLTTRFFGLFYEHSTGSWTTLDEIDWSTAEFTGVVDEFTLSPKTQEDFFNFRFDGYVYIDREGVYQFRISSNDGSRLSLNDSLIISNDGIHNLATVTAPIQLLSSGPHRITVDFFDNMLEDTLVVEYKGADTGNEWALIPREKLTSDSIITAFEPERRIDFVFFPNPVHGKELSLIFPDDVPGHVTLSFFLSNGQAHSRILLENVQAGVPIVVNEAEFLPNGFYFVEVVFGSVRQTRKVIIDR